MINTENIDVLELFDEFETKLEHGVQSLQGEFAKLKAGRANPHILDKITVDYYGTPTPRRSSPPTSASPRATTARSYVSSSPN